MTRKAWICLLIGSSFACTRPHQSEELMHSWQTFDQLNMAEVAVLGTYHFAQEKEVDELSHKNQKELDRLATLLAKWNPTKVVLEKEPRLEEVLQNSYEKYLTDPAFIDTLPNEIYQIGFRLAAKMEHERIYLFDNHPEFIGSLKEFTFEGFEEQAQAESAGLYDRHREELIQVWTHNDSLEKSGSLMDRIRIMNHPISVRTNAHRMHLYELRAGVDQSWIGPDWVGRWYQRNLRMLSYLFTFAEPQDRILVIVGNNHKWVLEQLLGNVPEFGVVPIYEMLNAD